MASKDPLQSQRGMARRLSTLLACVVLALPVVAAVGMVGLPLGLLQVNTAQNGAPHATVIVVGDGTADAPHNCRMYGAIGRDLPDGVLYADLRTEPNSLWYLSRTLNTDGWGIMYYPTPGEAADPCSAVHRGGEPAYNSANYNAQATLVNALEPYATLAHVRQGTSGCGGDLVPNPHPFFRGAHGRTWMFEHNGTVTKWRLYGLIDPDYLAANPPNCSYIDDCLPCTEEANNVVDSEVYFIWIMENIEEHGWNVPAGICAGVNAMLDANEPGAMNFVLTDGVGMWGFRRGNTLSYYEGHCGYGRVASAVPDPNDDPNNWHGMSDYELIDLVRGGPPEDVRDCVPPELLVDCAFNQSVNSADLRNNSIVQDWYESRNDDPTLLTLNTAEIGGNGGKKAALRNYGIAHNAYLTQEFSSPQSGFVTLNFDVYVDRIEDNGTYDRTALIYIGDDSVSPLDPPTGSGNERFVCMAFYDATPGDTGNDLQLRARTSSSQSYSMTSRWTTLTAGLSYDTWYRLRLVLDVAEGTYDVFLDDYLVGNGIPKYSGYASDSVTHISFSADSDGRGDFYVDGVAAAPVDPAPAPSIEGVVTWPNGDPAPNVQVSCLAHGCIFAASTMTDANGYYHLDNLVPSTYRVRARCRVDCTNYGADECPVVYDGCDAVTLDMTLQTNWTLCPDIPCLKGDLDDDPAKAAGTRALDSGGTAAIAGIGGVVSWNCGTPPEPAAYITVTAKRICAPDTYTTVSDSKGNYVLALPAGKYNLKAQVRVNGVTHTAIACNIAADGSSFVNCNLTLLTKLPYACKDCSPTPD